MGLASLAAFGIWEWKGRNDGLLGMRFCLDLGDGATPANLAIPRPQNLQAFTKFRVRGLRSCSRGRELLLILCCLDMRLNAFVVGTRHTVGLLQRRSSLYPARDSRTRIHHRRIVCWSTSVHLHSFRLRDMSRHECLCGADQRHEETSDNRLHLVLDCVSPRPLPSVVVTAT